MWVTFLYQSNGKFSKRAANKEFSELTDDEIKLFENKFKEVFSAQDSVIDFVTLSNTNNKDNTLWHCCAPRQGNLINI